MERADTGERRSIEIEPEVFVKFNETYGFSPIGVPRLFARLASGNASKEERGRITDFVNAARLLLVQAQIADES